MLGFDLLSHGLEVRLHSIYPTEMQTISKKDFECLASTGVNRPATMFPNIDASPTSNWTADGCLVQRLVEAQHSYGEQADPQRRHGEHLRPKNVHAHTLQIRTAQHD